MKGQLATALVEGQRVDSVFVIRGRELRSSRFGEVYLTLELSDRSGSIAGVMFKPDPLAESIPTGSVVRVRGTATSYRGVKRVSIDEMRIAEEYDVSDLLPRSKRDQKEAIAELRSLAREVQDPGLRRLIRVIFGDQEFFRSFITTPASVSGPFSYVGGLLDHTVSVATGCKALAVSRPHMRHDLLLAGALLHDIGAVDAIRIAAGFELTAEGRMLGHELLGERRISAAARAIKPGLDAEDLTQLSHIVLVHHEADACTGRGACSLEGLLLSRIDALDREASAFEAAVLGALRAEEDWTGGGNSFGRPLYASGGGTKLQTA